MDPWYLVFAGFVVVLGIFGYRDAKAVSQARAQRSYSERALGTRQTQKLRIPWREIGALVLIAAAAWAGIGLLEATMAHAERGTLRHEKQLFKSRGPGPLQEWTSHKHRRDRDGCSTSGSFEQC